MLKEFWVDRPVPRFADYAQAVHRPAAAGLARPATEATSPGRFLMAADIGDEGENADWKPVCSTPRRASAVPNGAVGFRYGERQGRAAGTCGSATSTPC